MSLHSFLTRLIWLCVVPLVALAIYLSVDSVLTTQSDRDIQAANLARNFATAIDQNLAARIGALRIMALSSHADDPSTWEELYKEAQGFRQGFGSHVIFADLETRMLFNTRVPYGTALPSLPRPGGNDSIAIAARTGMAAVSNIVFGPVANKRLVAITVPGLRGDKLAFYMVATFELGQFQDRLEQTAVPSGWSLALLDGDGQVIARHAPPGFDTASDIDVAGRFVVKSEVSPWTVVLEIPPEIYTAPLVEAATQLAIAVVAATLVGVVGGTIAGRRLGNSVAALAEGTAQGTRPIEITEIAAVRRLLDESATMRDAAEAARRESEMRFRATFEQAAVGIALVAPDGRWVQANRKLCDILGYDLTELLAMSFQDLTHPDDLGADLSQLRRMLAGEIDTYTTEKRYLRKGGAIVWINLTVALVRKPDSTPDYFISVVEDIQARRQAETARRESEAALAEAQRIAHIGSWYWNASTGAIVVSEELCRIYGREVVPPFAEQIDTMYPSETWHRLHAAVQEAVRTGSGYDLELPALRGDGTAIWINTRCAPVRGARGEVVGLRGTVQDITGRRRAEEALRELNASLEQRVEHRTSELTAANRELDSFSYSVSHDLRAPLRGIDGWSLALLEDYGAQLDATARGYLGLVRSETQRMGQLIDDLLQLSRVTRGDLRRESVDLSALAQIVGARLVNACPDRRIALVIEPGLIANADARLAEIAITNLFDNACKFTGTRPEARIEFGSALKRHPQGSTPRKCFHVRDNGVGFDMADASRLFSPFQRMHPASKFPGTGIGLATVRRIVLRHGGQVWAEAQVDRGAAFHFTFGEEA